MTRVRGILCTVALGLFAGAGCLQTVTYQPRDLGMADAAPPPDQGPQPDRAVVDMAAPDAAPPDMATPDARKADTTAKPDATPVDATPAEKTTGKKRDSGVTDGSTTA